MERNLARAPGEVGLRPLASHAEASSSMDDLPGQPTAQRPLHVFWIVDTSHLMGVGGKMARLDHAIRELVPELRQSAAENPGTAVLMQRAVFSSGARWITPGPVPVDGFSWDSTVSEGMSYLGAALELLNAELAIPPMPERAFPPVIILMMCGAPTDDWRAGLAMLERSAWGPKAVRVAVNLGDEEAMPALMGFTGSLGLTLSAWDLRKLPRAIRWVSTSLSGGL